MSVAGIGLVCAVVVIVIGATATSGGALAIAGGSIWLATSGFVLFDAMKVHSIIAKDVENLREMQDDFEEENKHLKINVIQLETVKTSFTEENKKLVKNIGANEKQIKKMAAIKDEYEKNLVEYDRILREEKDNHAKAQKQLDLLTQGRQDLEMSIDQLNKSLENSNLTVEELKLAKDTYVAENLKLQISNKESKESISELKGQVTKLHALYTNTQELLKKLALAGDMFQGFSDTISDTAEGLSDTQEDYDKTLDRMDRLLMELKSSKFKDMDEDRDGIISKDEFNQFINERK